MRDFVNSDYQFCIAARPLPAHPLPLTSQEITEPIGSNTVLVAPFTHTVKGRHSILLALKYSKELHRDNTQLGVHDNARTLKIQFLSKDDFNNFMNK